MGANVLRTGWLAICLMVFGQSDLRAAPIMGGQTYLPSTAIQDITLFPGTPFNPGSTPIVLSDFSGLGFILLFRDTQVGDTINIPRLDGQYFGSRPGLGSYVFGRIDPLTANDFSGQITNVVQDPTDPGFAAGLPSSFVSGDVTLGGNSFGLEFLDGPLTGIRLYTDPSVPFSFRAGFDGLPPSGGTVLQNNGPDVINVLFNGDVVGTSSNRRIVLSASLPEPASITAMSLGLAGLSGMVWRRRRAERT